MNAGPLFRRLLAAWLSLLVAWPALALLVLALFPPGWMFALLVAFYFYAVPALVIGAPHFSGEFMLPSTGFAFFSIVVFWAAVAAVAAFVQARFVTALQR